MAQQNGKFVAYFRVSTEKQGRSGLGLEAQRAAVMSFLNGGNWTLVGEFTEVESGKRSDRPQLAAALALCRAHRATLVIAKLDRLARNVAFISKLMEESADFVAADMPQANRLTVHILAAMAEHEREAISARTKAALGAAVARGVKLGAPSHRDSTAATRSLQRGRKAAVKLATAARIAKADRRSSDLAQVITRIKENGADSARQIAAVLNDEGVPTSRGTGSWQATQVLRIMNRLTV
jgi:DNA invertase Pin-like site-specific DNA recombinase